MTSAELYDRLVARYSRKPGEYATFAEVPVPGEKGGRRTDRFLDFLALSLWGSGGHRAIVAEIKVARSDWLRELEDPDKRAWAEKNAAEFWIVAPDTKIVDPAELPEGVGLYVPHRDSLKRVRAAKHYRGRTPTEGLLHALVKRQARALDDAADLLRRTRAEYAELHGQTISLDQIRRYVRIFEERDAAIRKRYGLDAQERELKKKTISDYLREWDQVHAALWRAIRRTGGEHRGYKPNPEEILRWVEAQTAPAEFSHDAAKLAEKLRELATRLDRPTVVTPS